MSGTLGSVCNEAVVACFSVLSWHSPGGAEENTKSLNQCPGLDSYQGPSENKSEA
jgi:hypothetical protein